jgi:dolichyl-phosphate-mannose--protein O-mannosyl transferase
VTKKQTTKDETKQLILDTLKNKKPETTKELIALIQKRHDISSEKTNNLLIELENEGLLHFTRQELPTPASAKAYMLSPKAMWYWSVIAFAVATTITVFTIPNSDYPIVYLRSALSVVFVLFLPGYAFIKLLLPTMLPRSAAFLTRGQTGTGSENVDTIERIALSIGMSLALIAILGLILNYTPWGIRLVPVTFSLLALTFVFATVALIQESQTKANDNSRKNY